MLRKYEKNINFSFFEPTLVILKESILIYCKIDSSGIHQILGGLQG